jgi:D-amino-acid dehydrogenase
VGGIHYPDDESGDAHLFCRALADAAQSAGVDFRFGTTVGRLRRHAGRIRCVETSAGALSGDAFVVAAGSYSPLLLAPLGIRLPIRPVKGYSITVPRGDWQRPPARPVTDDTVHAAVTPLGERIRVAGTAELAGLDTSVREARIDNLLRLLREIYPEFAAGIGREADIRPWSGLRPMSADGVPIMGATPIGNLFLNTGHGHLGWTMAAGSGQAVAQLVTGGPVGLPLEAYRLSRF